MKKSLVILLVIALTVVLVGCSKNKEQVENDVNNVNNNVVSEQNNVVNNENTNGEGTKLPEGSNFLLQAHKKLITTTLEKYKGPQKGSEVKNLIQNINMFNSTEKIPVKVTLNDSTNTIALAENKYSIDSIDENREYEVSFEYNEEEYISIINIK